MHCAGSTVFQLGCYSDSAYTVPEIRLTKLLLMMVPRLLLLLLLPHRRRCRRRCRRRICMPPAPLIPQSDVPPELQRRRGRHLAGRVALPELSVLAALWHQWAEWRAGLSTFY